MYMGWGEAARYIDCRVGGVSWPYPDGASGEDVGRVVRLLERLSFARGTGAGILNPLSASFVALLELLPLSVPVGACAVFILENGLKLLFGLGFSAIVSALAAAFSALDPIFS